MPSKEKIEAIRKYIEAEGGKEGNITWDKFEFARDAEPFELASCIVQEHAAAWGKAHQKLFGGNFHNLMGADATGPLYIIMPKMEGEKVKDVVVRKWDNILVNYKEDLDHFKKCNWLVLFPLLPFLNTYEKDMKDEHRKKKWEGKERYEGALNRTTDVSLASFVKSFDKEDKHKDAAIRDHCAKIEADFWPSELHWCNSADDYYKMYNADGGPSSCMSKWGNTSAVAKGLDELKFHPCQLYFYMHPWVQGAYLAQKSKITARSIIYTFKDGKKQAGRIYSVNNNARDTFVEELKKQGVRYDGDGWMYDFPSNSDKDHYSIPATMYKGKKFAQYPYFDNVNRVNSLKLEGDVFHFYFKKVPGTVSIEATATGYISEDQLMVLECKHCGVNFKLGAGGRGLRTEDGSLFCGADHAFQGGYCPAMRGDGVTSWILKKDALQDFFAPAVWYTNREAAIRLGAVPVKEDASIDTVVEDMNDLPVSNHGAKIWSEQDQCMICISAEYWHKHTERHAVYKGKHMLKKLQHTEGAFEVAKIEFIKPFRLNTDTNERSAL